MAKLYDVKAITGEYENERGEKKKRYLTCGVVLETKNGPCLKLEAIPVESNGWFMLFEPQAKERRSGSSSPAQDSVGTSYDDFDDASVPF